MQLKNTVLLLADATAASFAVLLAFADGVPTIADLLAGAELSMAEFLQGDPKGFKRVSDLSGISVQGLVRHAFVPSVLSRYQMRGHDLGEQHLLRGEGLVFPACLCGDMGMQVMPDAMGRRHRCDLDLVARFRTVSLVCAEPNLTDAAASTDVATSGKLKSNIMEPGRQLGYRSHFLSTSVP